MTREQMYALPPAIDVPTAAQVLGVGKGLAYELVRRGQWPTPVLRVGRFIKIPTAPLIALMDHAPTPVERPQYAAASRSVA